MKTGVSALTVANSHSHEEELPLAVRVERQMRAAELAIANSRRMSELSREAREAANTLTQKDRDAA